MKFLIILSLLLITISIVKCTNLESLTPCAKISSSASCTYIDDEDGSENPVGENNYCIATDNKIYISNTNSCIEVKEKIMIFTLDTDIFLYKKGVLGKDNGLLYVCDDTSCHQIFMTEPSNYYRAKETFYYDEENQYFYRCGIDGECFVEYPSQNTFYLGNYNATGEYYNQLIHCNYENGKNCKYVDIVDGYYIDGHSTRDKTYLINCSQGSCISIYEVNYDFYYYYKDASNPKNIITCNPGGCSSKPGNIGYYRDSGVEPYSYSQIIKCDGTKCANIEHGKGYYISEGLYRYDDKILIYRCSGYECSQVKYFSNDGYFVNGDSSDPQKLIFNCQKDGCKYYDVNDYGYYENADSDTKSFGGVFSCTKTKCTFDKDNRGFYWNAGRNNTDNYLISCSGSCTPIKQRTGIFVNSGSNKETHPVFNCDKSTCEAAPVSLNCTANGNTIKSSGKIKLCISTNDEEAVEIESYSFTSKFETFKVEKDNDFPGIDADTTIIVKISDNMVSIVEDGGLSTCTNISDKKCSPGEYCISNGIIYQNKYEQCKGLTISSIHNNNVVYFDDNYSDNPSPGYRDSSTAYRCSIDNKEVKDCKLLKGYTIINSYAISCSGWKGVQCTTTYYSSGFYNYSCVKGDEGKIAPNYKLCFGEKAINLPSKEDEISYVAFMTTKLNTYYGFGKGEIVLLALRKNEAVVTTLPDSDIVRFFINQTYDSSNPNSKELIKCIGSKCTAVSNAAASNTSTTTTPTESNTATTATSIIESTTDINYLDGYNKNYTITCNTSGCTSYDRSSNIVEDIHLIDNANKGHIITCSKNVGCVSEKVEQGIYVIDKHYLDNSKITRRSTTSPNLIKCDSNGCEYLNNDNPCASEKDIGNINYVNNSINICKTPNSDSSQAVWKSLVLEEGNKYILSKNEASKIFTNISNDYILISANKTNVNYIEKPLYGYYRNADSVEIDWPYIQCDKNSCIGISVTETSCTTDTIGKLINMGSTYPSICVNDNVDVPLSNWYNSFIQYNAKYNIFDLTKDQYADIYICPENITIKKSDPDVKYYINTNTIVNSKPLIKKTGSIYTYIDNMATKSKVYLYDGNNTGFIITCSSSGCISEKAPYGYYLNGGEDKNDYPILTCKASGTIYKEVPNTSCTEIGVAILKDNKYYMCADVEGKKIFEIKYDEYASPFY